MLLDIVYLVGTVVFFALMEVYVASCDRLGRMNGGDADGTGTRP